MKRALAAALLGATAALAAAQEPGDEQMLALIVQARSRGCEGHAGAETPLHWSPAVARAAVRIERGEPPIRAVEAEGVRSTRVFHATFANYRAAADVANAFAQHYCSALADPKLTEFGFHRDGRSWVVVLAAPVTVPELADRVAAQARVLALTNEARSRPRRCGNRTYEAAPPLRPSAMLERAAALHARDMATYRYVEHRGRDGSSPAQRASHAGYEWRSVGENIAAGQFTPEEVVEDWLSSPGHCANIMNPAFVEMGVAYTVNMQAKAVVYWAQEFGRPR